VRYGITDLYSSSFYRFSSEEERWAYWAQHIWLARFRPPATELYLKFLECVKGKNYFVITTNVDAQKAGFTKERIFATQGDYAYLQARSGYSKTLVYNEEWVREAVTATHHCRIPSELVPHYPITGELMSPNLHSDATFVEDESWHKQASRFQNFPEQIDEQKLLLLEFGVGFNTPSIIPFSFAKIALRCHSQHWYVSIAIIRNSSCVAFRIIFVSRKIWFW
jgi:hypothetical protein